VINLTALFLLQDQPAAPSRGPGLGIFFIQMLAFIAIIYFLMLRPKIQQEKRHRERLKQLKKGDEIVTAGGVVGTIVHLRDHDLTIKSGETRLEIQRDRIAEVRSADDKDSKAT
jgi:preprotein translocase subunit YajC